MIFCYHLKRLPSRNLKFNNIQRNHIHQKHEYDIPEPYRNAFYLANASLVDTTNWYLHNAIKVIYTELIDELENRNHTISDAVRRINNIIKIIEPCSQIIDLQFPVKVNDGQYEVFRGFRAQHGLYMNQNPCMGGLRMRPVMYKSDIKALAALSTYKHTCVGIDMLGSHGAILLSPKDFKKQDLHKIIETYTMELVKKNFCGECLDVIEPDMNCGSDEIKWIIATYAKTKGLPGNGCAVGKPVSFGGVEHSDKSLGLGVIFGLDEFLNRRTCMDKIGMEGGWSNKTFILQGLGRTGGCTATYLASMGVKCTGIIDEDCSIHDENGINIEEALHYKNVRGTLQEFMSRTKLDHSNQVLIAKCDILILAAMQNTLSYYTVQDVQAKIVIEAANAPIAPSVHKMLLGRGKLVLPDLFINAGSSIVSYLEYMKNIQQLPMKLTDSYTNELILQHLDTKASYRLLSYAQSSSVSQVLTDPQGGVGIIENVMRRTIKEVVATAEQYALDLDLRTAAYVNVIKKLFWTIYENLENRK